MKKSGSLLSILCMLLFLFLLLYPAQTMAAANAGNGTDSYGPVLDKAKLLPDDKRKELIAKIRKIENEHDIAIGICTLKSLPDGVQAEKKANEILKDNFSYGHNGGIVLLVVMDNRKWQIATNKAMREKISDGKGIAKLKELFLDDMSKGNYFECFTAFVDGVDKFQTDPPKDEPFITPETFNKIAMGTATVVALLISVFAAFCMVAAMSNVAAAKEANDYLKKDSVDIRKQQDNFLGTTVTRCKRSSSSDDSSSSSSSGGGGGGGSF